jgi:hypothetical protein
VGARLSDFVPATSRRAVNQSIERSSFRLAAGLSLAAGAL